MHTYNSSNGYWSWNGTLLGQGYSGHGDGVNNPALENIKNVGPIPRGRYLIEGWFNHPELGPFVARLLPCDATNTFGRAGFCVHGDNFAGNHTASEGCIIMNRIVRNKIADTKDTVLEVV